MGSELRFAVRQLLRSPGFSAVAIVGLALGIGANVALFSVVNSVFLRPLPYREPDRLVRLSSTHEAQQLRRVGFSHPRYLEVAARQQVFSDLALSVFNAFTWTGRGDPEQLIGLQASAALLPTLGLQPALGPQLLGDRRPARRRARGPRQPRALAAAFQRRSRRSSGRRSRSTAGRTPSSGCCRPRLPPSR